MNNSQKDAPAFKSTTLLNETQLASRWGISIKTLRNKRVSGGGPTYIKIGRSVRYCLQDAIAFENDNRRSNTSDMSKPVKA